MSTTRTRADRCPGVLRPWPADDGLLVRLRLVGGRISATSLLRLLSVAERYADGRAHPTARANLQVRRLPDRAGALPEEVVAAIAATGLLPSRTHELVRNVMVSPATGVTGGRVDLRPVAAALDRGLCASPPLARLPGRFLMVLDDGRGDLLGRPCDLGLVALDAGTAQLRVGDGWGAVIPVAAAAATLCALAEEFVVRRGAGEAAVWHVRELAVPLAPPQPPDPRLPAPSRALPYGQVDGGRHVRVAETGLDGATADDLLDGAEEVVVTPWHGILVPDRRTS